MSNYSLWNKSYGILAFTIISDIYCIPIYNVKMIRQVLRLNISRGELFLWHYVQTKEKNCGGGGKGGLTDLETIRGS